MEHKFKEDLRVVDFPNDVTLRLIKGRQRIEEGWCQVEFEYEGSYCALGAVGFKDAEQSSASYNKACDCSDLLYKALPRRSLQENYSKLRQITLFNDDPNRDRSEILDLFDRAIATSIIGS